MPKIPTEMVVSRETLATMVGHNGRIAFKFSEQPAGPYFEFTAKFGPVFGEPLDCGKVRLFDIRRAK